MLYSHTYVILRRCSTNEFTRYPYHNGRGFTTKQYIYALQSPYIWQDRNPPLIYYMTMAGLGKKQRITNPGTAGAITTRLSQKMTRSNKPYAQETVEQLPATSRLTSPALSQRTAITSQVLLSTSVPETNLSNQYQPSRAFVSPAPNSSVVRGVPNMVLQPARSFGHESTNETSLTTCSRYSTTSSSIIEKTIVGFSRDHVWPKLKLIPRGKNDSVFDYSETEGTLCVLVLSGCNIPCDKWQPWWPSVKAVVAKTITGLRNNKVAAMRKAFFGKIIIFMFFWLKFID